MGAACNKCRTVTIDVIPDKAVMLDIVDKIVAFEELLKAGGQLTAEEQKERKKLEPVARALKKAESSRPPKTMQQVRIMGP